jgi:hypothetical protein
MGKLLRGYHLQKVGESLQAEVLGEEKQFVRSQTGDEAGTVFSFADQPKFLFALLRADYVKAIFEREGIEFGSSDGFGLTQKSQVANLFLFRKNYFHFYFNWLWFEKEFTKPIIIEEKRQETIANCLLQKVWADGPTAAEGGSGMCGEKASGTQRASGAQRLPLLAEGFALLDNEGVILIEKPAVLGQMIHKKGPDFLVAFIPLEKAEAVENSYRIGIDDKRGQVAGIK